MKALISPVAILSLLSLYGCSSSAPEPQQAPDLPVASLDNPTSITPQSFTLRGEVVVGHEARTIKPCGSNTQYWLALTPEDSQQAMTIPQTPYQVMYGEVTGHLEPPSQVGFDSDYKARFVVDEINVLATEGLHRCKQPASPTSAFGMEPFWSVRFEKDALLYRTIGEEDVRYTVKTSQISQDERIYQLDSATLTLTKEYCSDTMSDSLFSWSSTLERDGKSTLKGCATLANSDRTLGWTGFYHASSTQSTDFQIRMELNPDHSATTHYDYNNDEPSIVESGYWQQLNDNQVQVVMTRHHQQFLVSERIFTRQGDTLVADKEKVSDTVYPIANGGLTLFKARHSQSDKNQVKAVNPENTGLYPSSAQYNQQVDQAVRQYFADTSTETNNAQYRWLTKDLNQDGKEELLVLLDWCGSGGCTLIVFDSVDSQQPNWQFNSRITLVRTPFLLGTGQSAGWKDLIMPVSGGGAQAAQHLIRFSGENYPMNPSTAPVAAQSEISDVQLFSDGLSPRMEGVRL